MALFAGLLIAGVAIAVLGVLVALDGSRDVFHPLVFIGPMFIFLYGWMPWKLQASGGLLRYFEVDQLLSVQWLNVLGILAFTAAALAGGVRLKRGGIRLPDALTPLACRRLFAGATICGLVGLVCWSITIVNVGGFVNAYSSSYSGGWDDSGYIRDGTLLLLVGILLSISAVSAGGSRLVGFSLAALFTFPWLSQALLLARRGPTFAWVVVVVMGWYINRGKRPPVLVAGITGLCLGWLVLFLVTNRASIYLGSDFDVSADVSAVADKADTGNEFIYGTASVIAAEQQSHYFWMRRYLAQILVRPIPSAIWPTKYEDFGVPEILHNAGTGEGITAAFGWVGAPGSAPGIVADLWVELWWLAIPAMAVLGGCYGLAWRKGVTLGGAWSSQYVILSALSIYLVMQTMEAVIFRTILLSIPCWATWRWATLAPTRYRSKAPESIAFPMRGAERA